MDKDAGCIREISRRVQLSKSTVSKALHNCGNVDAGTKEEILRAAREVQYDPAGARRAKIQAGETVVGVVLPINPYAFWNEAIRGVKDAIAAQKGVHLSISLYAGMHSEADALYCLDYMEDMRADVLVVTPAPFPAMTERLRDIAARIPVVFFNETADGVPFLFYAGANFYQDGMRLARAPAGGRPYGCWCSPICGWDSCSCRRAGFGCASCRCPCCTRWYTPSARR